MPKFRIVRSDGHATEVDCEHVQFSAAEGAVQFYRDSQVDEKGKIKGILALAINNNAWREVVRVEAEDI